MYSGSSVAQPLQRHVFTHVQMGTLFRVILYAADAEQAKEHADECFRILDDLNLIFSDYLPSSELSRVTADSSVRKWQPVNSDLYDVLRVGQEISIKSEGAFDLTIGPLTKLWRRAYRRQEMPSRDKITEAIKKVDYRNLLLDGKSARIMVQQPGVSLDAGGIAKGYALDKMANCLEERGVTSFLLDAGGDIKVGEAPPGAKGWEIQLVNGDMMIVHNSAIVTSGNTYRYLEWNGQKYGHLIDPRTGWGRPEVKTLTVMAPTGVHADAWATSLAVMGKDEIEACQQKGYLDGIKIIHLH